MTRKLQFLFTALLLVVGVTSAWADAYDDTSAIYNSTQGKNYSSLATAVSEAAANDVIVLFTVTYKATGSSTAIQAVEARPVVNDNVYYNLQGRRVLQPTRGLYIVNGKKVIVK